VKPVQDEDGVGAVVLDGADVALAHVAAGPFDLLLLVVAQLVSKEPVDGFTAFALTDPDDTGSIQIIDDGGLLVPFAV